MHTPYMRLIVIYWLILLLLLAGQERLSSRAKSPQLQTRGGLHAVTARDHPIPR